MPPVSEHLLPFSRRALALGSFSALGLRRLPAETRAQSVSSAGNTASPGETSWTVVNVADYGAKPNDGADDAAAVQAALDACRGKKNVRVVFPEGTYDFGRPGSPVYDARRERDNGHLITFDSIDGLIVEGNGATLTGHAQKALMLFRNCRRVTMRNLTVDWDPLGYTTGNVVAAVHNRYFDMEVVSPHTARGGDTIQRVLGYDPVTRRLCDVGWYEKPRHVGALIDLIRPNVMRVYIPGKQPAVGSQVIAFHIVYGSDAFNVFGCEDFTAENVNLYSCPGSGFVGRGSRNITLRRFRAIPKPGTDRALTTTADVSHFADCRGLISFEDCVFDSGADDATNIHSFHYRIGEIAGRSTILFAQGVRMPAVPQPGDRFEISGVDKPMVPYFTATVKEASADPKRGTVVTFAEPLPSRTRQGDILANVTAVPAFRAVRCTVRNIRPRGFLLQTRDILVDTCTFEHTTGAGIHMGSDAHYWWEGIGVRKAVIRNCRFLNCNFDGNINRGGRHAAIDINARANTDLEKVLGDVRRGRTEDEMTDFRIAPAGVHQDIILENNYIQSFNNIGAGMYIASVDGVTIRNNTIVSPPEAAIELCEARNVVLTGNTAIDARVGLKLDPSCDKATIRVEGNTGL